MRLLISVVICILFANLVHSLDKSKHCKCRIQAENRIVGGRVANNSDYPWMVSIANEPQPEEHLRKYYTTEFKINLHTCGGVIVNERWILTAAHCVEDGKMHLIGVGNDNDLVKMFDKGKIFSKRYYIPSDYLQTSNGIINDIALVELNNPIEFSNTVLPGCLETSKEAKFYGNQGITAVGYGFFEKLVQGYDGEILVHRSPHRYLKEADYKDKSDVDPVCLNHGLLCLNSVQGVQDSACFGDSGGPMHHTRNGKTTIIGLCSYLKDHEFHEKYLIKCNGEMYYTRVGSYIDWIERYVGSDHC